MSSYINEIHPICLLSSVRKRRLPETRKTRYIRVPAYMLCFITAGEEIVVLDGALKKIRPFQLYLLAPGMMIEFPELVEPIEYYALTFEPLKLLKNNGKYEARNEISDMLPLGIISIEQPQYIFQQIVQLYHRSQEQSIHNNSTIRIQFEQLLHHIVHNEYKQDETVRDERVERSISYMEQHFHKKISIEQLAEAAGGMSLAAFSHLFRLKTGQPPVEYLSKMRMNHAKQLLKKNNSLVKEVAAAVGFRSEFYFSRMFQRMVGVSPTLFMKRGKLKVAVASSLAFGDHLRALGMEPICEVDLFHYPDQTIEQYSELLNSQLVELEHTKPDLIIADHYHTDFKDQFKRTAAPVFMDFSIWDWKRNFERIAELVNREREASEMLTQLYVQIEMAGHTLRKALGEERVTILQVSHRAVGIQGRDHHPLNELVYGELALSLGGQAPNDLWRMEVQPESMPLLETEHLFIHHHHERAGSKQIFQRLTNTPVWSQINAVQCGKVHRISNWFVMSWNPLGRQRIIAELLTLFERNDAQEKTN